ncbi:hypothetical protein [Zhongshania marina]|uniref:hypothetical protein n=1 Tax=Zhongshania marina TaxID=2304603 RepID=UPI001314D7AC
MNINGLVAKIVSIHEYSQSFRQNNDAFCGGEALIIKSVILLTLPAEGAFVIEGVA